MIPNIWENITKLYYCEFCSVADLLPPANVVCKGYIFTGVCDSVKGGHAWLLPGGMRGCSGGACVVFAGGMRDFCRGACVVFARGGVRRIRRDTVNERAVRILLECILVQIKKITPFCVDWVLSVWERRIISTNTVRVHRSWILWSLQWTHRPRTPCPEPHVVAHSAAPPVYRSSGYTPHLQGKHKGYFS